MNEGMVKEVLFKIEEAVANDTPVHIENEKVELKDLSSGTDWVSLRETICAFLNTDGGIIITGVKEIGNTKPTKLKLTGVNLNNEDNFNRLGKEFFFTINNNPFNASEYIATKSFNILDNNLIVIYVTALPQDLKFVQIERIEKDKSKTYQFFKRKLSADEKISNSEIKVQHEYLAEREFLKELLPIEGTSIENLSIEKVNRYIEIINKNIKAETLKVSLSDAKPFLAKRQFIDQELVTTLGLLVCGDEPEQFLGDRVEVACYYDTKSDIGKDVKRFRNDIINLMDDAFTYIWRNIKIGRKISNGGISVPEYPEELIREIINNALAHRDYSDNRFTTITIEPGEYIEIKNPGSFKEKMLVVDGDTTPQLRYIIQGIAQSKNPRLAALLRTFDKIENEGRGLAALLNAALDNKINLPYYLIQDNMIRLRVPTGNLLDDGIKFWLDGFKYYLESKLEDELSDELKLVLAYFYKAEKYAEERKYTILLNDDNNHLKALAALKKAGILVRHPKYSEQLPIYMLDRPLVKQDYKSELKELFNAKYYDLNKDCKQMLNLLYRNTVYNNKGLKPFEITPELYLITQGEVINPTKFESLGRQVRSWCSKLAKEEILVKESSGAYRVNVG